MDLNARLEKLRELYAELPTIDCQGKCANSCGVIDMSTAEHDNIVNLGVLIPSFTAERAERWANNEPLHCPALNRQTLRCDVYEDRPLICRVWGVADSMPCPHGCKPSRVLSDIETYEFLLRSYTIGGHHNMTASDEMANMIGMLKHPEIGPLMGRFIRGDRTVEIELIFAIERVRGER